MADPGLLLASLDAPDRAAVERFLSLLGMEPHELDAVPPLRSLVETLAVLTILPDVEADTREGRFREAADALGLDGGTILRRWYRWQASALRQSVRPDVDAA